MIRVHSLEIQEFRGIRNLKIEMNGDNFAICGPNGTGKSGVVDALDFVLTGGISRLEGTGTENISVKRHGPHVDSRDTPDKAKVRAVVEIPSLGKMVSIERTVKDANAPLIEPNDEDVKLVLKKVGDHPEFVLSRREIIQYILAPAGKRAEEIQALLRLDSITRNRSSLQSVANAFQRSVSTLNGEKNRSRQSLLEALQTTGLTRRAVLEAVNGRRGVLGLEPLIEFTATTSIKDGLQSVTQAGTAQIVPKRQALMAVTSLQNGLQRLTAPESIAVHDAQIRELEELARLPMAEAALTREQFLRTAVTLIEQDQCPVCDTPWDVDELKQIIESKLSAFDHAKRKRASILSKLRPVAEQIEAAIRSIQDARELWTRFEIASEQVIEYRQVLEQTLATLEKLTPLDEVVSALRALRQVPAGVTETTESLLRRVTQLPQPNEQDAARDYLNIGQDRLDTYRSVSSRFKQAEEREAIARRVSQTYDLVSTSVLHEVYDEVEREFRDYYRLINADDEAGFKAKLTPSTGRLGFDVDFYGRGLFPPGAYHSEGHQDVMGLCLYLALMHHLLGAGFVFAVFDDVLMSVDAGHRRQVCALLKERFPDTQFILTTHDKIWLQYMKSGGLVSQQSSLSFSNWDVEHGPKVWDGRDVWTELTELVDLDDIRGAASLLRYYLEFISGEWCNDLHASVDYRGDARYQLGDLLPSATSKFRRLLKDGKKCAQSWQNTEEFEHLTEMDEAFSAALANSKSEEWHINPAVHYNSWENFEKQDFVHVVAAFREVERQMRCESCGSTLYLVPDHKPWQELRCRCAKINVNLQARPS